MVGRGERIKPVIKVAALGVAIVAENFLYRKMRQSGWRLRPFVSVDHARIAGATRTTRRTFATPAGRTFEGKGLAPSQGAIISFKRSNSVRLHYLAFC